jgi:aryl carrier-like protein
MWSHVLDVEESKIEESDDFFQLGGNSVTAIRLANEARLKGWDLNAATVFRLPVLGDMANAFAASKRATSAPPSHSRLKESDGLLDACAFACGLDRKSISDVQPLTPIQRLLASLNRESGVWVASLPFKCENVSLSQLEACVAVIRQRNPILRARTVLVQEEYYSVIVEDDAVWETATNLSKYISQLGTLRVLYGCPQARYGYIEDGELGSHFVLTITHTIMDAWSRKLIYQQLEQGLQDLDALSSSPVPASFSTFAEFVAQIDRDAAEKHYSAQMSGFDRWSYLDGRDSGSEFEKKLIKKSVSLTKEVSNGIITSEKVHVAWILALSAISGEDRVFALSTTSGRLAGVTGTEDIIGPMLTTIPVCVDLRACETVLDAIDQVRTALFDSVPYEALAALSLSKRFGHMKLETLLNVFNIADVDGMEINSRDGKLVMRLDRSPLYGRMTGLLNARVIQSANGSLELLAGFQSPALEEGKVQNLIDSFAHYLQALHEAGDGRELKALRASYDSM